MNNLQMMTFAMRLRNYSITLDSTATASRSMQQIADTYVYCTCT